MIPLTSSVKDADPSQTVTHLSVCSGYDGLGLGLARVFGAIQPVFHVEIEAYAVANLVAKMETHQMAPAPIWTDVKTFPFHQFRNKVDILSAGYPCQPFANCGKRKGTADPRHLWPYLAKGIQLCKPTTVFLENVEGHITLGLREVLSDLEELGYKTTWGIFSAAEVGYGHQRKRVFILAHSNSQGLERRDRKVLREHTKQLPSGKRGSQVYVSLPHEEQHGWEASRVLPTQRRVGRATDGASQRVDRIRLLGNGVVPAQAEHAFRTLAEELWGQSTSQPTS
tara:strand:- start:6434 stop:7279 length:846 start_codon:yes stop_codon:yes gene_type:complete